MVVTTVTASCFSAAGSSTTGAAATETERGPCVNQVRIPIPNFVVIHRSYSVQQLTYRAASHVHQHRNDGLGHGVRVSRLEVILLIEYCIYD